MLMKFTPGVVSVRAGPDENRVDSGRPVAHISLQESKVKSELSISGVARIFCWRAKFQ